MAIFHLSISIDQHSPALTLRIELLSSTPQAFAVIIRVLFGATILFFGLSSLWSESPIVATSTAASQTCVLKTPYKTEQEWIVGSICRNAFELLSFIPDKNAEVVPPDRVSVRRIDSDNTAYQVTLNTNEVTVNATLYFSGSIWSSDAYVPFCQAAMDQLKIVNGVSDRTPKGNPLTSLLEFSEASIEAENARISQWLTQEPNNVFAHQQAALVLGTLAMKENSGWFWDPREICNHASAHLAVARSLDSGNDLAIEGRLAECLVGLIADTKTECAAQLSLIEKTTSAPRELNAWLRAARMRNSRDWRLADEPKSGSGFEQVEYFRALGEAVNIDQAIAWMRKSALPHRQDWTRIVLEFSFSVEAGHEFALPAVKSELAVMNATFPNRFDKDSFIAALNETPEDVLVADSSGTLRLQVISGGMWARFFQRHICHALIETGDFLQNKWGVQEQAEQFDTATTHAFGQLDLFPYLRGMKAIRLKRPSDPAAIAASFTQHPEWAPSFVCRIDPDEDPFLMSFQKAARAWFSPPVPSGTAYAASSRLWSVATDSQYPQDTIHKLYQIAPLQYRVAELELINRYSKHPTHAEVQEIMGPLVDYYLPALNWVASARDLAFHDRTALRQKAATLDPDGYRQLAQDLLNAGYEKEAADAYQQWFDKGTDRVAVANGMEWLVNYYYDHGQEGKAVIIAKYGARVYSHSGLTTMLNLLVRLGQFGDAEEYGKKIQERYDDSGPLLAFYQVMVSKGNADFRPKLDAAITHIFPSGLKSVTLGSFAGAPKNGMQFSKTTAAMAAKGLSSDQIVVALDGYQVQNVKQYTTVRSFSQSPDMAFIVWNGQAYEEIKVRQPGRRFGVDMANYLR